MKVVVTAEDVAYGVPKSCSGCPVATAVKRATSADWVYLTPVDIVAYSGRTRIGVWKTPLSVRSFVASFDSRLPVGPFEFELS